MLFLFSENPVTDPPNFDPPSWVYLLSFVAFIAALVFLYYRRRWIRISLIGAVIGGTLTIPGANFSITSIGLEFNCMDLDVYGTIVASLAIIFLAVLEFPYCLSDYQDRTATRQNDQMSRMRLAMKLVAEEHLPTGKPLANIAQENAGVTELDLLTALFCATDLEAMGGENDE